ncbi:MAG: hypothetical protein RL329_1650 [Bacteroidota bacterium]|jgi:hypothetical protein
MKSFEKWLAEEVEITFGVQKRKTLPLLDEWMNAQEVFNALEMNQIERLRNRIAEKADEWNEDELKMQFIALLLDIVDYNSSTQYGVFSQRPLLATIQGKKVNGVIEYMLAQGRQIPRKPFFFFHEYKQETKRNSDPKGQLLISMLAAQTLNDTTQPLYGCYVVGRFWFFLILDGNQYAVSDAFTASQSKDIFKIVSILRSVKIYINNLFK